MNLSTVLATVLGMSATASVIALIIMILRRIAGRVILRSVIFALWGVMILKLIIPLSIPSPTSLYNVVDIGQTSILESVQTDNAEISQPSVPIEVIPSDGELASPVRPDTPSMEQAFSSPVLMQTPSTEGAAVSDPVQPEVSVTQGAVVQIPSEMPTAVDSGDSSGPDFFSIAGAVYCGVASVIAVAIITAYAFTAYRIGKSEAVNDARISGILGEFPDNSKIRIKKREGQRSIMIFGILHPTIILPDDYESLSDTELRYLLMHEYQHYRHMDTLWNLLMLAACAVHWFNPIVWISRRFFLCDMETACDARVLSKLSAQEKSVFAEVLVSFAARCSSDRAVVAMGFGKRNVKERVLSIMKYKKTGIAAAILSVVVLVAVVAVFATGADDNTIGESESTTEITESTDTAEPAESEPKETEPAESKPKETEPAESKPVETEDVTEPVPEEPAEQLISTDKSAWRAELSAFAEAFALSDESENSVVLEFEDIRDFKLTVNLKKDRGNVVTDVSEVFFKGNTYDMDFDAFLAKYPDANTLDIASVGDFVAVGMRNYLGTYYVFMDGGYTKREQTDDVGYYVWSDGADLWYMKQNRAFERISAGADIFINAYESPEQFYMDFGKIVSVEGGTLSMTKTAWTVQDYFMSDSFVMASERDKYGYTSVDEFVADYNAGTLGGAEEEILLYPLPSDGTEGETAPTVQPDLSYNMQMFKLHVNINSEWLNSVFPDEVAKNSKFSHAVVADYANFKALVAGFDSVSNEIFENVVDGTTGTVKHTELLEAYDESFFNEKALVAVYINAANLTDVFSISEIGFEADKKLVISIKVEDSADVALPMCESRLYLIELDRDVILYADSISVSRYIYIEPIDQEKLHTSPWDNYNPVDLSADFKFDPVRPDEVQMPAITIFGEVVDSESYTPPVQSALPNPWNYSVNKTITVPDPNNGRY